MSYLKYANLCSDMVRAALLPELRAKAKTREVVHYKEAIWKDGKPEKQSERASLSCSAHFTAYFKFWLSESEMLQNQTTCHRAMLHTRCRIEFISGTSLQQHVRTSSQQGKARQEELLRSHS